MLVSDNEYGAPWNDRFYWVEFEDENGVIARDLLILSGPANYTEEELLTSARAQFPYVDIINVEEYEVCR